MKSIPTPDFQTSFGSFHSTSILKLRLCSSGHLQLKSKLEHHTSISLNSHAREISPTLQVQEYIDQMCILWRSHWKPQGCWRVKDGAPYCEGQQIHCSLWVALPYQLIFEPEPQSQAANDINENGI
jgi:hypothetical protein